MTHWKYDNESQKGDKKKKKIWWHKCQQTYESNIMQSATRRGRTYRNYVFIFVLSFLFHRFIFRWKLLLYSFHTIWWFPLNIAFLALENQKVERGERKWGPKKQSQEIERNYYPSTSLATMIDESYRKIGDWSECTTRVSCVYAMYTSLYLQTTSNITIYWWKSFYIRHTT